MSTEQHEALKLADEIDSREWFSYTKAADTIRTLHALIAQIHTAFEGEHFEHDDQRAAIAAATQYLTRGPKT